MICVCVFHNRSYLVLSDTKDHTEEIHGSDSQNFYSLKHVNIEAQV